jgi:hypothetical protein
MTFAFPPAAKQELLLDPSVKLEAWQAGNEHGDLRFALAQRVQVLLR